MNIPIQYVYYTVLPAWQWIKLPNMFVYCIVLPAWQWKYLPNMCITLFYQHDSENTYPICVLHCSTSMTVKIPTQYVYYTVLPAWQWIYLPNMFIAQFQGFLFCKAFHVAKKLALGWSVHWVCSFVSAQLSEKMKKLHFDSQCVELLQSHFLLLFCSFARGKTWTKQCLFTSWTFHYAG